jgi:DNA-binding MarR family transcriptional regulator
MTRHGADLALLLLGGFRTLADAAVLELAERGFVDFRPAHEFAMRAIVAGADSASDLARRTSVSKQAAAKTIALLRDRGYVDVAADPSDARRKTLRVTELGFDAMREGEAVFEELRADWVERVGVSRIEDLESTLAMLVAAAPTNVSDA